jgi:ribonuclease BN (tRNA processing enzyme)
MEGLYNVWKNNHQIGTTRWTLSGNSVAGIRTAFQIPELKIQLDAGYQSFNKISDIFITHSHADHVASLPLIILENISDKIKTNIYCPKESKKLIENMITSFLMCNYNSTTVPKSYYNVIGLDPRYLLDLKLNKQNVQIKSFYSDHTVPTLSYGFIEKKQKLKDEFKGLDGKEIFALKSKGIEITSNVEYRKLVFCGDTSIKIFGMNPDILTFDNIVIECTFFEEEDLKLAQDRKHMHWLQLKPIISANPSINFYLIHISAKYHDSDRLSTIIGTIENVFIL